MIRHGDSPMEGNERLRGLTEKGQTDVQKLTAILKEERLDVVVSSPYRRSIASVEKLAHQIGKDVLVFEDLREKRFSSENERVSNKKLLPLLERSFLEPDYTLEGGESNNECQERAVKVLKELLITYNGKNIAIGTHGTVMTLMMGFFDPKYDLAFLHTTSKPDIYRLEFNGLQLLSAERLWNECIEAGAGINELFSVSDNDRKVW